MAAETPVYSRANAGQRPSTGAIRSPALQRFFGTPTARDIVSGLVSSVVTIATTVSYAVLIFSGPLAANLPVGIGYGLISAAVTAAVFAVASGIPFAIAGPDSKPVAVLATLGAVIAADLTARGQAAAVRPTVLIALVAGTLLTGIVLFLMGALRTGRWMRFVPYPVIGGFLAASGWLLVAGSIRVLTGTRLSFTTLGALVAPEHLLQLAVGVVFAIAITLLRYVKHPLAFPALLVGATLAMHAALQATGYSLSAARQAHWLIDIKSGVTLADPWFSGAALRLEPLALLRAAGDYAALVVVTASTLLLNTMAIEVETRVDVDLDRELRANGISNLLSGLLGGMVGTLLLTRTLFNYRSGARHRVSGLLTGVVSLLTLGFGTQLLGFIPLPLVGALLMQLGATMLYDWLVKGWGRMPRTDYALVVAILVVIVSWDFVAGIAVGVVAACVTFAINSSRIRLVKRGLSRSEYASRVDRPPEQHKQLLDRGNGIQIMWLHGFVFFGSANRLLLDVKDIVTTQGTGVCRMVILDFHQVLGIDSSAVVSLIKLRHFAEREGLLIAVSDLPPAVETLLRSGGFLGSGNDDICKAFPDLDAALEWCEDRLLTEGVSRGDAVRSADEWLTQEIGGPEVFARLRNYLKLIEHQPGQTLFAQGDEADCLYIVYEGRVTVLFKPPDGAEVRLRSMVRHTVVGEMGLYRTMRRGASVRVDEPTIVYALSRDAMNRMEKDDPTLAYAFHKFIIRTLAARLDFANREVASLQRG